MFFVCLFVCFFFICVFRKYMFRYNLYFEALKGLLLKTHLIFFLIFAENVTLLSRNIIKLISLGSSTSKYKKVRFLYVIIWGWSVIIIMVNTVTPSRWFKGGGMGPLLVLVSPCFRENVVATCKTGSFLCSLDNLLQKNVIVFFFFSFFFFFFFGISAL